MNVKVETRSGVFINYKSKVHVTYEVERCGALCVEMGYEDEQEAGGLRFEHITYAPGTWTRAYRTAE